MRVKVTIEMEADTPEELQEMDAVADRIHEHASHYPGSTELHLPSIGLAAGVVIGELDRPRRAIGTTVSRRVFLFGVTKPADTTPDQPRAR